MSSATAPGAFARFVDSDVWHSFRTSPMAMIAVGYQTGPEILDEETKAKELRPRARKPLAERFFEGAWGSAVAMK